MYLAGSHLLIFHFPLQLALDFGSLVTKPDPDDFVFEPQRFADAVEFLSGGPGIRREGLFQSDEDVLLEFGAFPSLARHPVEIGDGDAGAEPIRRPTDVTLVVFRLGHFHPRVQNRLQFTHVEKGEGQSLVARNGGLREGRAVDGADRLTHILLRESQLDALRLELFRARLWIGDSMLLEG